MNKVYVVNVFQPSNHNEAYMGIDSVHANPKSVVVKYSKFSDVCHKYINIQSVESGGIFYNKAGQCIQIVPRNLEDCS